MPRPRTLAVLLACTALLPACGGGDGPAATGSGDAPATARTSGTAAARPPAAPRSPDPAAQRLARRVLAEHHGSVAALEVGSGRVIALAGGGRGGDPTGELVAPGSTLKTLIGGVGLAERVITPAGPLDGDREPAPGTANVDGAQLGPLTLAQALAQSSNTAFAGLMLELGPEPIEAALRRAGWGRPAAIDLPAARRATSVADVAPLLDGDGRYVDVDVHQRSTVLQLAQLAAAVAGDGSVPRAWLRERPAAPVGRLWSAAVSRELRRGLRLAVQEGTGTAMQDAQVAIAGKTGTIPLPDGTIQASTIAFAPLPRPTVALAVSVRAPAGATGGTVAAPLAGTLLRALARR